MDTKWKKSRAVIGFATFFLGVVLLLSSLWTALGYVRDARNGGAKLDDAFQSDYQDTSRFQHFMENRFERFLTMAVGGPLDQYGIAYYEEAASDWIRELGTASASAAYAETKIGDRRQAEDYHQQIKGDRNLLYQIVKDGKILYTNEDALPGEISGKRLPEGYTFTLVFSDGTVSITKDGAPLDLYGDGVYQAKDGDWYLPGYQNFPAGDDLKDVKLYIAATGDPVTYYASDYANGGSSQTDTGFAWLCQTLDMERTELVTAAVTAAAGVLLLAVYVLLRRDKAVADRAIARATGHIWFEGKALLVLLLCFVAGGLSGDWAWSLASRLEVSTEVGAPLWWAIGRNWGALPLALVFAGVYLFVNDLRYNKKSWRHGLCGSLSKRVSPLSVQRKLNLAVAGLLTAAVLSLLSIALYFFSTRSPLFLLTAAALICLFLFLLYRLVRLSADLGVVANQIEAVRAGNYAAPAILPENSDLLRMSQSLADIESGLDAAIRERTKSERMKVELITNVSHDIKTPLTAIISYIELLKRQEDLPPAARDYVAVLDAKAQKLRDMIQDVFEVSKAASGQLPVALERLDLKKLLEQTLADMDEAVAASPVTVRAELPPDPVFIEADGNRLYRVFQNLIGNALKYSLEGSRIYLSLETEGRRVAARVKNISKNELHQGVDFTERFTRGDDSRTDGGTGLGLSIAKSFTEACGGSFAVETDGDRFTATVAFDTAT